MKLGPFICNSLEQTHQFAGRLARVMAEELQSEGPDASALIGLFGPLGAGKTAFAQGFVKALSPEKDIYVSSPTYAISQIYPCEPPVTHMDLYRLGGMEDLEGIGYEEHYFGPGITLVEWMERALEANPEDWIEIHLAAEDADVREIRLQVHGARWASVLKESSL